MLLEFYQQSRNDGKSCHATYILSGLVERIQPQSSNDAMQIDDEIDFLSSSPFIPTQESGLSNGTSSKTIRAIILADENNVTGKFPSNAIDLDIKKRFIELTSIHVYSLAPSIINVFHLWIN
jgi:DNA polymerase subunit Cdc27